MTEEPPKLLGLRASLNTPFIGRKSAPDRNNVFSASIFAPEKRRAGEERASKVILHQIRPRRQAYRKVTNFRDEGETNMLVSASDEDLLDAKDEEQILSLAMRCAANPAKATELANKIVSSINEFNQASLPATPKLPFEGGDVIDYLRAEKGLGPWNRAKVLSRSYLKDHHERVYWALVNYLRKNELPEGIYVPTKSQLVDKKLADPDAVAEAKRIRAALQRRGKSL